MSSVQGIDADGYILAMPELPIQPAYRVLVQELCKSLAAPAKPLVDGIYLYGSVAKGCARPGVSDLDVTLILSRSITNIESEWIEQVRQDLECQHPEVTKIDFDIGYRSEALAEENAYRWGYWLKHHCRCVWGNDLGKHFKLFKPSRSIALAVNGDFPVMLAKYASRIEAASSPAEIKRLQREAARKLLRSTNVLRSEEDLSWPMTLEDYVQALIERYPGMKTPIQFFLSQAHDPTASSETYLTELRSMNQWMSQQVGKG